MYRRQYIYFSCYDHQRLRNLRVVCYQLTFLHGYSLRWQLTTRSVVSSRLLSCDAVSEDQMEAAQSSETMVSYGITSRRHNTEDRNVNLHCRENLKIREK
jgi:hypothetical protein